jgi:glycine oxidase
VKTWDVIIIGGGIIGLSLAIELRKSGTTVLLVEKGEPGHEASHAAAGMLVARGDELPPSLRPLAIASAEMYPEFVHELQDESGINVDLREDGCIVLSTPKDACEGAIPVSLAELEPALANPEQPAFFLRERWVDPRALGSAALKAAKHRGVDIVSGSPVVKVLVTDDQAAGVATDKSAYHAATVVNCAGAWAGTVPPLSFPIRPVKGQMLAVAAPKLLRHVVRTPDVYLVPRSNGRILIGSTLEDAGYDKRVDPDTINRMHRAAIELCPALENARVLEAWAGLRPGTRDDLPMLGETGIPGYFVAAGHYRDGILLAPVTARIMAQIITSQPVDYDLAPFTSARFHSLMT